MELTFLVMMFAMGLVVGSGYKIGSIVSEHLMRKYLQ